MNQTEDPGNESTGRKQENPLSADCGCSSDCCTPKRAKPWKKVLFFLVLLAMAALLVFKFTQPESSDAENPTCATPCADTVKCSKHADDADSATVKEPASCCESREK
jgi:hypothetical protein